VADDDCIRAEATVVTVLKARLFRVTLANGHPLTAHLPSRGLSGIGEIRVGDRVLVEMSPYDLSMGRIASRAAAPAG
jgi:translation initiation factor IF-1